MRIYKQSRQPVFRNSYTCFVISFPVRTVRNKAAQFAQTLQKSMKGLGTNDDMLVRTVITRCEREMVQIKQEFQQRFDGSLGKWIAVSIMIKTSSPCKSIPLDLSQGCYIKRYTPVSNPRFQLQWHPGGTNFLD